ncbi:DUF4303 domain-containing protein [Escherichia coli]|uniref:DUF4303 domain-containing protein n=1 Tax=Escherichia coli TaxID=562 RepID=UPI001020E1EA|nr:DUF4303 domain-containing protein [Escherichia coli]MBY3718730.1 DUF4303 domain-containing protein [Escherichia coli]
MVFISEEKLLAELEKAIRMALQVLFKKNENFYYCSLITTGEALPPSISAWSHEALERFLVENNLTEKEAMLIKWSYAESPYFDFGNEYFDRVRELFFMRLQMNCNLPKSDWDIEFNTRLKIMETAMKNLDEKGFFGVGDSRNNIVINVEVMPPDYSNTLRAMRLNPSKALSEWLSEAAEPIPLDH